MQLRYVVLFCSFYAHKGLPDGAIIINIRVVNNTHYRETSSQTRISHG